MIHASFYFLILIFFASQAFAQDNSKVITYNEFLAIIGKYHPIVRQAKLIIQKGNSNLLKAKGAFDPVLFSYFNQKQFDSKPYFAIGENGLKVPTALFGIELKAGYDFARGNFLNPQNSLPDNGIGYLGITIPIGQGFLIDERRALLRQAELMKQSTEFEAIIVLNNLYFDAINAYWDWAESFNKLQVYNAGVQIANTRFEATKKSFEFGDSPAIDTLEALVKLQDRMLEREQARIKFIDARLNAQNFLWFENDAPLVIDDDAQPIEFAQYPDNIYFPQDSLEIAINSLAESHPELIFYNFKLAQLNVDRDWKSEKLKPKLNLTYNALAEQFGLNSPDPDAQFSLDNFKWGLEFSFPLLLRDARGELELQDIKINETIIQLNLKKLEIENKIRNYFNKFLIFANQSNLYSGAVENYKALVNGEIAKLNAGESSLFLVNSREDSQIKAQIQLIEIKTNYQKSFVGFNWAAGNIYKLSQ